MSEELYKNRYRIKSTRLPYWNYSSDGFYYVTMCTSYMIEWLGKVRNEKMFLNDFGEIVEQCWQDAFRHYPQCEIDKYIIMPNHFHGIIRIVNGDDRDVETIHELSLRMYADDTTCRRMIRRHMLLPKMIGRFKMQSAKQINKIRGTVGERFWQGRFYDRIIRSQEELEQVRWYIRCNPQKWQRDRNNLVIS
jgi:putative transposase